MTRARAGLAALLVSLLSVGAVAVNAASATEAAPAAAATADPNADVHHYGSATHHGDTAGFEPASPVVDMAATATGDGYWLVSRDGGIFAFGDAAFHGSMGAVALNEPIVGMAATPSGEGYWLAASDGGIFAFGDAAFHGSMGAVALNEPIVGMAATPSGEGYWLAASDGGIFAFGDATFHGSAADVVRGEEVTAMAAHPDGGGYWLARAAGPLWPLTGLPTPEIAARPALAVKIDNHALAGSQWGLNQADIVFEELVEGGLTRFVAVFHSQSPAVVGPVRSARETDVGLLPMFGESLLAYSGGNRTVRSFVDAAPTITGVSPTSIYDGTFYRTSRRVSPHNLLWAQVPEVTSVPRSQFAYRDEVVAPQSLPPFEPVLVDFGGSTATWSWNGSGFARVNRTRTHFDADGVPVTADNVVLLEVPYVTSGSTGSPVASAVGSGRGRLLTDGTSTEVTWTRVSEGSPFVLVEVGSGDPGLLAPGRTWVELVPTGLSPFTG